MAFAWAANPAAAWLALADKPDVLLLDLNFSRAETSGTVGLELLTRLMLYDPTLPVVVITGHSGVAIAVAAMRAGATDFIIKPWRNDRLAEAVARAAASRSLPPAIAVAEETPLLGDSAAMVGVRGLVAKIAPTRAAVLIHGGPGTGKSLVAATIHRASGRDRLAVIRGREEPTPDVISTTAIGAGTLLIEDVDRLSLASQARLATAIRGGPRAVTTSRAAPALLRATGGFDDELLTMVSPVEIDLPLMPARGRDAVILVTYYLGRHAARHGRPARPLDPAAEAAILADPWPDGVRGLAAACERAVVLGDGPSHGLADFALSATPVPGVVRAVAADFNLAATERQLVEAALKRQAYNVSRAAVDLGITRATLYRRMARHGL